MFLLWKGINHELTSGVGNGRRIRTGSCKIRAGKNRKKADAGTIRSLQIEVNSASSLALACSAVQTSSAALSKAGLSCQYQCPSFAEVSSVAEMLNVRGRRTGRAGVAAKPAKTHSACKCCFHLHQANYPNGPVWKSNWSNQYMLGEWWGRDAKEPPGLGD